MGQGYGVVARDGRAELYRARMRLLAATSNGSDDDHRSESLATLAQQFLEMHGYTTRFSRTRFRPEAPELLGLVAVRPGPPSQAIPLFLSAPLSSTSIRTDGPYTEPIARSGTKWLGTNVATIGALTATLSAAVDVDGPRGVVLGGPGENGADGIASALMDNGQRIPPSRYWVASAPTYGSAVVSHPGLATVTSLREGLPGTEAIAQQVSELLASRGHPFDLAEDHSRDTTPRLAITLRIPEDRQEGAEEAIRQAVAEVLVSRGHAVDEDEARASLDVRVRRPFQAPSAEQAAALGFHVGAAEVFSAAPWVQDAYAERRLRVPHVIVGGPGSGSTSWEQSLWDSELVDWSDTLVEAAKVLEQERRAQ